MRGPSYVALVLGLASALAVLVWPRRSIAGMGGARPGHAADSVGGDGPALGLRDGVERRLRSWGRGSWGSRPGRDDLAADAAYAELLGLALHAGLPAPDALAIAEGRAREPVARAPGPDWTAWTGRPPAGSHPRGPSGQSGPAATGSRWPTHAERPDLPTRGERPDLPTRGGRLLRLAWSQSVELGTPLSEAVSACAAALQADHEYELRRRAAAAGPRASMWLLTALPVIGPLLGSLVGLGPDLGDPVVLGLVGVGLAATGAGWLWARQILRRADRPTVITPKSARGLARLVEGTS